MASIIVNNYNYECFLQEAIDSVLNQTYSNIEVIVVDDGSTDNSREIIASYGDRITPLLKENGGMASNYNASFPVSQGEVIFMLDSDDVLLPIVVDQVVNLFHDQNVVQVHWPLWIIDEHSRKTGGKLPDKILPEGNLLDIIIRDGPWGYISSRTSGNAWSRRFLEEVLPIPELEYKRGSEGYLVTLASLFGTIKRILEPQGKYRIHNNNDYAGKSLEEKIALDIEMYNSHCIFLSKNLRRIGLSVDPEVWKGENSPYIWLKRVDSLIQDIAALVRPSEAFILVDNNQLENYHITASRRATPFLERNGQYWGAPSDDETAIRELERLRQSGANFIIFMWLAFWWLDHYEGLHHYLRTEYQCVLENNRLVVFELRCNNL